MAAKVGCNYFCTNVKVTVCKSCGYINKQTKDVCTKCKSHDISHATRVIGYLKQVDSFSSDRQIEHEKRYYLK